MTSADLLKKPTCTICTSSRPVDPASLFCLFKGRRVPFADSCRLWTPLPSFVSVAPSVVNFGRSLPGPSVVSVPDFLDAAGVWEGCSTSTTATNYHK